jgi:subtilisin family serine protease
MNRRNLRYLAYLGTLIVLLAVIGVAAGSQPAGPSDGAIVSVGLGSKSDEGSAPGIYIVQLVDPPVASYQGGISGLEATNPATRGEVKLDASSEASIAYENYLEGEQAVFLATAEAALGRNIDVRFTYQHAYNGLAIVLHHDEAEALSKLDGLTNIQPETIEYIDTDYGPEWIGAAGIWEGTSTGGLPGTMGEGVIVGVIDTGINLDHPSFADIGGDGYDHINPWGTGNYSGLCASTPGTWVCNDKLIGYHIFTGETTEDTNGHGSHTSSTAAGNVLISGTVDLEPYAYSPAISGVAPHANVIGYDGCNDAGGCPGSATLAAINQAVVDAVDVINYSIGGGTSNPWTSAGSLAFLAAQEAGIVPVTSAGNNGPGASTVGSPGDSPWMMTVGSSTHNRAGVNEIVNMTGGDLTPPADFTGKGFSAGYGPALIVYAGDFGDAMCLTEFGAGTWTEGEIVVCDRGTIARVAKGWNVLQGGAGGYILANADPGQSLNGDVHHLPAVHIVFDDGVLLKDWIASGSGHLATIAGTNISVDPANADSMAGSSSRGPLVNTANDIIKPDVTAPGVDIIAAYRSNPPDADNPTSEYGVVSGTSMSSPMTAGAAALMRALYPGWSASEIQSAMMSTGITSGVVKEDGSTPADPFDMGGGRVNLFGSGQAGLVLGVPPGGFQAANPSTGGDPSTLNLASMANNDCDGTCSWTREVKSTLSTGQEWDATLEMPTGMAGTVTPTNFFLGASSTALLTIEIDSIGLPMGDWAFAELRLDPVAPPGQAGNGGLVGPAPAHLPIAVIPSGGPPVIEVDPDSLSATIVSGTTSIKEVTIGNSGDGDLDWSIFEQVSNALELVDWSDNFDSYATGSQMHGQGDWKGWADDVAAGALTSDAFARSAPNSVDILTASDLVHEYTGYTSGLWTYTAWQYIPDDLTGESYFILLNQYDDAGATDNWSTQVHFNGATGQVLADGVGAAAPPLPMITGQWVELRVEIDLNGDNQEFYYDDELLYSGSWSDGVTGGGILAIGAVDLFANGASSVFYDDISLVEREPEACEAPSDIPWLSVSPDSGTTPPGDSDSVDVTFDASGVMPGTYSGMICVSSNDPVTPIVPVYVSLKVENDFVALPLVLKP